MVAAFVAIFSSSLPSFNPAHQADSEFRNGSPRECRAVLRLVWHKTFAIEIYLPLIK